MMLSQQPPDWRLAAACRSVDSRIFFPVGDFLSGPAKVVCATCPVQRACLEWALRAGEPYGIWGGLTAKERRAMATGRPAEPKAEGSADAA